MPTRLPVPGRVSEGEPEQEKSIQKINEFQIISAPNWRDGYTDFFYNHPNQMIRLTDFHLITRNQGIRRKFFYLITPIGELGGKFLSNKELEDVLKGSS